MDLDGASSSEWACRPEAAPLIAVGMESKPPCKDGFVGESEFFTAAVHALALEAFNLPELLQVVAPANSWVTPGGESCCVRWGEVCPAGLNAMCSLGDCRSSSCD